MWETKNLQKTTECDGHHGGCNQCRLKNKTVVDGSFKKNKTALGFMLSTKRSLLKCSGIMCMNVECNCRTGLFLHYIILILLYFHSSHFRGKYSIHSKTYLSFTLPKHNNSENISFGSLISIYDILLLEYMHFLECKNTFYYYIWNPTLLHRQRIFDVWAFKDDFSLTGFSKSSKSSCYSMSIERNFII